MSDVTDPTLYDFVAAALAASNVGTYERDPARGLVRCDPILAHIYGLSEDEAAGGVSLARLRQAIHPDDRHIFSDSLQAQAHRGGLLVIEYRVRHPDGRLRWVLVRGRYEPIEPGHSIAAGRGIVIDITESKLDGYLDDGMSITEHDSGDGLEPHHRAVDHALALYEAALAMGEDGESVARAAKEALIVLGKHLAQEVPRWEVEE